MLSDSQTDRLSKVSIPFDDGGRVESRGDPGPRSAPTPMPCHGPDCDTIMVTYLTDADKEVSPTAEVQRIQPETGDPRRTTLWFCSDDCRTAFTRSSEREGALCEAGETLDREPATATTDGGTAASVVDDAAEREIETAPTLDPHTHNQIVAVVQQSPDATVAGVLGELSLAPSQADAVEAIIETPVAVPSSEARDEDRTEGEDTMSDGQSDSETTTDDVIEVEPADSPAEIVDERPEEINEDEQDDTVADDDALDEGIADESPADGESPAANPGCESENATDKPLTDLTDSPLAETPPRAVVSGTRYPPGMIEREYWVPTARDEEKRKRPRAPYITGHSYPAKWGDRLPDDQRPETEFETVRKWARFDADELAARGDGLPDSDLNETLQVGAILPRDRPPQSERITLIDWDDVRHPETGEIHPICAAFLRRCSDTYADISTSGTGIHQLVYGGLGAGGKFIAHIDDEPAFDCLDSGDGQDDWPQVEIYDGGRHIAMTGQHVEGSGGDLIDGQECIETLVEKFSETATALPRGMTATDRDDEGPAVTDTRDLLSETPDNDERGHRAVAIGEPADYGGYDLDERPDDRPRCYHAALCNRADPDHKPIANWESIYYIALLGRAIGFDAETVVEDLRAFPTPGYGFDETREPSEVESAFRHADSPPSTATLHAYGILPSPGCDPDCPAHAPGTAQTKRSGDGKGTDEQYRQMPMWAMRNVAYGAGHDPANDIWRSVDDGQAVTDDEETATQIQAESDGDLYRALPAKAHNLTLDIIEDAGRHPDEHGRSRRTLTDDSVLYTPDEWK
jgi:hypothetical protein